MLIKKEICEAKEIAETTFRYWQNQGLIPPPSARKNRAVAWPDTIIHRVDLILDMQARGKTLDEIRAFLKSMDMHSEDERQRTLFDGDNAKAVVKRVVEDVTGISVTDVQIFIRQLFTDEAAPKYYSVVAGKEKVVLAVVDSESHELLEHKAVSHAEYAELMAAMSRITLQNGMLARPYELVLSMSLIPEYWNEAETEVQWRMRLLEAARNITKE